MRLDSGSFLRQTPLSCYRPSTEVPTARQLDRQSCANATALAVLHNVMQGARGSRAAGWISDAPTTKLVSGALAGWFSLAPLRTTLFVRG